MRKAEHGDDVARLVRSVGLQGFRYRAFGNRPVRPAPTAEPPQPLMAAPLQPAAVAIPAGPCAAPAADPAPPLPVFLTASPMPDLESAPAPAPPGFSLLRQAIAAGASPATQPAPRPAAFSLLPNPALPAGF